MWLDSLDIGERASQQPRCVLVLVLADIVSKLGLIAAETLSKQWTTPHSNYAAAIGLRSTDEYVAMKVCEDSRQEWYVLNGIRQTKIETPRRT